MDDEEETSVGPEHLARSIDDGAESLLPITVAGRRDKHGQALEFGCASFDIVVPPRPLHVSGQILEVGAVFGDVVDGTRPDGLHCEVFRAHSRDHDDRGTFAPADFMKDVDPTHAREPVVE